MCEAHVLWTVSSAVTEQIVGHSHSDSFNTQLFIHIAAGQEPNTTTQCTASAVKKFVIMSFHDCYANVLFRVVLPWLLVSPLCLSIINSGVRE